MKRKLAGIMAAVMAGGMVPPIAIALCTTFFKKKFTENPRVAVILAMLSNMQNRQYFHRHIILIWNLLSKKKKTFKVNFQK